MSREDTYTSAPYQYNGVEVYGLFRNGELTWMSRDEGEARDAADFMARMCDMTDDQVRDELATAEGEILKAEQRARFASWMLPALPNRPADQDDNEERSPWEPEAQIVESGYARWTKLEWQDDHWHAWTDGWDDMSEGGTVEYVQYEGRAYAMLDNADYD
jgi:hypothetical protein